MNTKSKALLAVMAVALMLGCALVPLTVDNDSTEGTDATTEGFTQENLLELLGLIKEEITNISEIEFDGNILMPVESVSETPTPVNIITGINKKTSGSWTFSNCVQSTDNISFDRTTNTTNERGRLVIESGATFVLFPLDQDNCYRIKDLNKYSNGIDRLVVLMPGAYLNIFGMTFQVIKGSDDDSGFTLIGARNEDRSNSTFELICNNAGPGDQVSLTIDSYNAGFGFILAELEFTDTNDQLPMLSITGKLKSSGTNGISLTDAEIAFTSYHVSEKQSELLPIDIITMKTLSGNIGVKEFTFEYDVNKLTHSVSGKIAVDIGVDSTKDQWLVIGGGIGSKTLGVNGTVKMRVDDFSFSTGTISFEMSNTGTTTQKTFSVSVTTEGDMNLHIGKMRGVIEIDLFGYDQSLLFSADDYNLTVSNRAFSMNMVRTEATTSVNAHFSASVAESAKFIGIQTKYGSETITIVGVNDYAHNFGPIAFDAGNGVTTLTVGEVSYSGKITGYLVRNFEIATNAKISNIIFTSENGLAKLTFNASADMKVTYNGKERTANMALDNAVFRTTENGYDFTADSFVLEKDLPSGIMAKGLDSFLKEMVPEYLKLEVKGIAAGSENGMQAEYVAFDFRNYSIFSEFHIVFNDNVKIVGEEYGNETTTHPYMTVSCGEVKGSYRNIGCASERFSITEDPVIQLVDVVDEESETSYTTVYLSKGNAAFGSGVLPLDVTVGKDAKFSAKGVAFEWLSIVEGATVSGTVTLDGKYLDYSGIGYLDQSFESVSYVFIDKGLGYKAVFDPSDLSEGTVEAYRGFILPAKYSGDGYTITSDDGKTGKVTVSQKEVQLSYEAMRDSFVLSYEDDFAASKTYAYGDRVLITEQIPTKDGFEFVGWSDGAGNIIDSSDEYTMPARDVTLKPVFMKTVTPTVVKETIDGEEKTVLIADADDAVVAKISATTENWDLMRVTVNNTTVELSKDTYDKLETEGTLYVISNSIDKFDDENIESAVGDKKIYGIMLLDGNGDEIEEYSAETSFKVTVNVKVDGDIKDFKVSYFDPEYGYFDDVAVDSYERQDDGSYNVTFTVNHFSMYAVEPVYKDTFSSIFTLVIIIIAIIVLCVAVAAYFTKKKLSE